MITGPSATEAVYCLQELHAEVRRRRGSGATARVIVFHLDTDQIGALATEGDRLTALQIVTDTAQKLRAAGARQLLIGSSALQSLAQSLATRVELPVCEIDKTTAAALKRLGFLCAGIVGTRTSDDERMWNNALKVEGVAAIYPRAKDRNWIQACLAGETEPDSCRADWVRIVTDLRLAGATAIVLCSPLENLYLREHDSTLPVVCASGQQVQAAVEAALG